MIYAATLVVFLGLTLFVAAPLLSRKRLESSSPTSGFRNRRKDLREQKALLLLALRELDFDYEIGKLSPADYKGLREKYENRAVGVLKVLEEVEQRADKVRADLEEEVQRRLGEVPGIISKTPQESCSHCGEKRGSEDLYCASCGKGFGSFCSACGEPATQESEFCSRCGVRVESSSGLKGALAILFLFLTLASSVPDAIGASGAVSGKIVLSDTKSRKSIANVPVRLSISEHGREVAGAETQPDERGNYRFPNLSLSPSRGYRVTAVHHGVPFSSNVLNPSVKSDRLVIPDIEVIPTTGDIKLLTAEEVVLLEFSKNHLLRTTRSIKFTNQGAQTYDSRTDGGNALEILLPVGGFDLDFHQGLSGANTEVISEDNLLRVQLRVDPGEEKEVRLEYSYLYPIRERAIRYSVPLPVPRSRFSLLLREKNYSIESDQLQNRGTQTIQGVSHHLYSGGPIRAGELVRFTVSGFWLPKDLPNLFLAASALMILLASLILIIRRSSPEAVDLETARAHTIDALVALEQARRRGELAKEDFERKRHDLSDQYMELES